MAFCRPAGDGGETRNVLVLYSNNRLVPGNVAVDRGLRAALQSTPDRPVQLFSEFLDRPEFSGEAYEATMTTYLREKYAARPPDAIVAVSDEALDFLLRNRAQLFPGVPLVHAAVSKSLLQLDPALPADVVGVPIEYDFAGTIEQALRWHPAARAARGRDRRIRAGPRAGSAAAPRNPAHRGQRDGRVSGGPADRGGAAAPGRSSTRTTWCSRPAISRTATARCSIRATRPR